ncbi:DNA mismatch repair protein MutS domain protein [Petrotoga mobilis SJ95]|jgi:dsDNA-specific endonuclease/ATPase MutS2|uniref:DNA mismatch repair protein MutS domain protein n=1 Tax=Petrotoga mobilis (strain DSM 10674 / SJ95) TaxID=403833 RepID=A9BG46_PETMO|nr:MULTISPECIES: DNA mismatch repair protein MutS [Petrotoga]ABX31802.1 DNA mismatch repair protein MutS domain protein [Petrotoga mobilis SJ95]RLL82838.1 DNA mismatch repair protein MutS [Petrotoga sp. Shatin.DS.tank11.9.2.9.3]RLL89365.1 DNA mismatch repair protein MutS [Petrotoga sp. HKA.pet.4.5]
MDDLEYILQKLDVVTPLGVKKIKNLEFYTNTIQIKQELDKIEEAILAIKREKKSLSKIKSNLKYIKDINYIIGRLKNCEVLDDIELFEIKFFSIYYEEIRKLVNFSFLKLPSLEKVIAILDPEGNKLPTFYIYNSYSRELASIRRKRKNAPQEEKDLLYQKEMEIEEKIRYNLSVKLTEYSSELEQALKDLEELDFILAKAELAMNLKLSKPELSSNIEYEGLFNPLIKEQLEKTNQIYQPINIKLGKGTTLITGANMTGKTVILRSLALSQYLFQYGFYVPARHAKIKPVDKIFLVSGDYQSILSGLSSYAAEILKLNEILTYIKQDDSALILLDEIARNTNPHEGRLIVKAVIKILNNYHSISVVTTHFNNVAEKNIKKFRIKGIKKSLLKMYISPTDITELMDYSLIEDKKGKVPEEALTIAKMLNIDKEFINTIEELKKEDQL